MKTYLVLVMSGLIAAVSAMAQPNPTAQQTDQARRANYCSDPWVTLAIWNVTGGTRNPNGVGQYAECNVQLYNGGRWQNYAQLRQAVSDTVRDLSSQGVTMSLFDNRNNTLTAETRKGAAYERITVVGRIAVQNGSNVIAQGAGNIVSHDGGTLIGQDGAGYTLLSATKVKIKLPGGRVLILGK